MKRQSDSFAASDKNNPSLLLELASIWGNGGNGFVSNGRGLGRDARLLCASSARTVVRRGWRLFGRLDSKMDLVGRPCAGRPRHL